MASEIRVNKINNRAGLGTVEYTPTGIIVSGIVTAYEFDGNFDTTPGIVVTGIGTAQSLDVDDFVDVGNIIKLGNAGVVTATTFSTANVDVTTDKIVVGTGVTIEANQVANGQATFTGVVTATTFVGALTGTASGNPTLSNGADNRIITATGANALTGETNLTWTGNVFETNGGVENWTMRARSTGPSSRIGFQNQYLTNGYTIGCGAANQSFVVYTGGNNDRLRIDSTGITTFSQNVFFNKDIDVDGHTNLDNVNVAGVSTFTGQLNAGAAEVNSTINVIGQSTFRDRLQIVDTAPEILLSKPSGGLDSRILNDGSGNLIIGHGINSDTPTERLRIASTGNVTIHKDLDVDGHTNLDNVSIAGVTTMTGNLSMGETLTISGNNPNITFTDTNSNPDYKIYGSNGAFTILDSTNGVNRFAISSTGNISISNDLDVDLSLIHI